MNRGVKMRLPTPVAGGEKYGQLAKLKDASRQTLPVRHFLSDRSVGDSVAVPEAAVHS